MAIKLRRGTDTQRLSVVFEEGEIAYTTDTKKLYIGDGVTAGGNEIGGTTAAELLKVEVHNATGSTVAAGAVVYLNGNTGNKPNLNLAKADAEATSSKTIGLVTASISNNANGEIATDGLLEGLNTSAFIAGDLLWLSDSIAGGVTTIVPDTPNHAVFIGYVVRSHPTQGSILIHIQNGYELNELHDVKITSVADGDVLSYDSTLGYWKNIANSSFTPPNGLLKLASAISTTFQVVKDYLDNASVLFLNSRRVGIGKDTSVTTQSVAVVEVQDANTSIVLKPNGTGAIIASVPDGTTTGGNARGNYSVDLQRVRDYNSKVAAGSFSVIAGGYWNGIDVNSGYSVITGGANNRIVNGGYAFIGSGNSNFIDGGFGFNHVIVGGSSNTCGGGNGNSFIGGGSTNTVIGGCGVITGGLNNTVSSTYSTVSGGQSNTASTNTHATVVGGQSNTASGQYSVAGGQSNTVSGVRSVAFGQSNNISVNEAGAIGVGNVISGLSSYAIGGAFGEQNAITSNYSFLSGTRGKAYLRGSRVHTIPGFEQGNSQIQELISWKQDNLLTAATTVLSLDGTGTTNLIIPNGNNRAWNVTIDTIAVVTAITGTATGVSVGDCYRETKQLLFKRIGGTSSIVGTIDTSAIKSDTSMSTAALTVTAGASKQMAITFTAPTFSGGGSVTCRVVSKVSLVEVAY